MKQGIALVQTQAQRLALTQGMRQSIMVLQQNVADLTGYLQDESLGNPLFEVKSSLDQMALAASDSASYQIRDTHVRSLEDYLLDQVSLTMRATPLRNMVVALIQLLDDDGYLRLSNDELCKQLRQPAVMVVDAVTLLQQLDPPGIGARDLQECLLLQTQQDDFAPAAAERVLENCFEALVARDWTAIQRQAAISQAECASILDYLHQLSAKPAAAWDAVEVGYIMPDLALRVSDSQLTLSLITRAQPQLVFAQETYDSLHQSTDLAVREYVAAKKAQYLSLEESLQRRRETLLAVARVMLDAQRGFFLHPGTPLKPLLSRDVAQRLQLSESTVSRAIKDKYIQTEAGNLPLSDLLSRRSGATTEGEGVSADAIIRQLKTIVASEPAGRPYSDSRLVEELHRRGITIARRTVAKYREAAQIAKARERKRL